MKTNEDLRLKLIQHLQKLNENSPLQKQLKYCKEHNIPFFAPIDGRCWHCKNKIEDTGTEHIISCPHCNRTFCD